jgi:hypothetical protein
MAMSQTHLASGGEDCTETPPSTRRLQSHRMLVVSEEESRDASLVSARRTEGQTDGRGGPTLPQGRESVRSFLQYAYNHASFSRWLDHTQ